MAVNSVQRAKQSGLDRVQRVSMCVCIDLFIGNNERMRVGRKQRSNKRTRVGVDVSDH